MAHCAVRAGKADPPTARNPQQPRLDDRIGRPVGRGENQRKRAVIRGKMLIERRPPSVNDQVQFPAFTIVERAQSFQQLRCPPLNLIGRARTEGRQGMQDIAGVDQNHVLGRHLE